GPQRRLRVGAPGVGFQVGGHLRREPAGQGHSSPAMPGLQAGRTGRGTPPLGRRPPPARGTGMRPGGPRPNPGTVVRRRPSGDAVITFSRTAYYLTDRNVPHEPWVLRAPFSLGWM